MMFTNSEYAKKRLEELGLLGKELGQCDIEYENAVRDRNGGKKIRVKG